MLERKNLSLGSARVCENMITEIGEEDGSSRRLLYTRVVNFSFRYIMLRTDRLHQEEKKP